MSDIKDKVALLKGELKTLAAARERREFADDIFEGRLSEHEAKLFTKAAETIVPLCEAIVYGERWPFPDGEPVYAIRDTLCVVRDPRGMYRVLYHPGPEFLDDFSKIVFSQLDGIYNADYGMKWEVQLERWAVEVVEAGIDRIRAAKQEEMNKFAHRLQQLGMTPQALQQRLGAAPEDTKIPLSGADRELILDYLEKYGLLPEWFTMMGKLND